MIFSLLGTPSEQDGTGSFQFLHALDIDLALGPGRRQWDARNGVIGKSKVKLGRAFVAKSRFVPTRVLHLPGVHSLLI